MITHQRKVTWAGCKLARHNVSPATHLPWRRQRTPYRIFLAEMLLVRTRSDVVARVYEGVFEHYPDIHKLAEADQDAVQEVLYPLGLSKRVPYFIQAARFICEEYDGEIPNDIKDLLRIPGVGIYTATAIAAFAYGQPVVPSDVNILRFISRITGLGMENRTKGSKKLRDLTVCLSESQTGLTAERLLDFTRLICRPRNPLCEQCPLTKHCSFFLGGT